ncbi:cytidylate kinase-like family protein [Faecalimonas sp.]
MNKKIITIGRQFGSNGRLIGRELANRLEINCYDKGLIKLAAEHTDIPYEQLKLVDEKKEKPWQYQVDVDDQLDRQYRYGHIDEVLFNLQSQVIRDLASKEDCIFVGRCADYVLKDENHCKNIYLFAPIDVRIKTIMERYNLSEKKAQSLIKKVDKDRSYYYNFYTDKDWHDIKNYHLSIDTSVFTIEEIVDLLEFIYNHL